MPRGRILDSLEAIQPVRDGLGFRLGFELRCGKNIYDWTGYVGVRRGVIDG
jgi:hypothetical protein